MARYGYARVSSTDQDCSLQEARLRAEGCKVIRTEKASGKSRDGRDELARIMDFLHAGDEHGPDLYCSSSPAQLGVRGLQGPQSRGGSPEGHLPGRGRTAGEDALAAFEDGPWGGKYAAIAPSWRRSWGEVVPFYACPAEVRRLLYTTNAIEALNAKLRRAVRARGHFPTDEAALKLLFLVLNRSEKEWTMPAREWCMARVCGQWAMA